MNLSGLAILLLTAQCAAPPSAPSEAKALNAIMISLETEGGISGRGLGSVVIEGDRVEAGDTRRSCHGSLSVAERDQLGSLFRSSSPQSWLTSYAPKDRPHGPPDAIRYTLTAGEHFTSWFGEAPSELPQQVAAIRGALWAIRNRVLHECP